MEPPSSAPSVPKSGEDLTRAFRNLPPGTLAGLDALCDHNYWLSVMRQSEIEISNEDIFRFRFSEISKTASNRLAFLAGSGEYGTFNLRYLIQQLVEQCSDMHKYTRKLEKYVVKLQRQVEELESTQRGRPGREPTGLAAAEGAAPSASAAGGGAGASGGGMGAHGGGGGGGSRGGGGVYSYPPPRGALAAAAAAAGHLQHPGGKRPRSPQQQLGSVETAGMSSGTATHHDDDE